MNNFVFILKVLTVEPAEPAEPAEPQVQRYSLFVPFSYPAFEAYRAFVVTWFTSIRVFIQCVYAVNILCEFYSLS